MSTSIGPHEFTEQDVHTTLEAGWALFELLEMGLPDHATAVVAPHRVVAESVLEEVVAGTTDPASGLEAFWGEWRAAMVALRTHGAFGPSAMGSVTALWRSDGGTPKDPVETAEVGFGGLVGDRQEDRKHHGRPWQALCLWSNEVIDEFRAQGHPLQPGLAGENITVTGLDWERLRPGVHLRIGDVLAEVSSYAVPCSKNRDWFVGGRFDAMHHRNGPISRIYATVLEPGHLTVGDPVLLEPDAWT